MKLPPIHWGSLLPLLEHHIDYLIVATGALIFGQSLTSIEVTKNLTEEIFFFCIVSCLVSHRQHSFWCITSGHFSPRQLLSTTSTRASLPEIPSVRRNSMFCVYWRVFVAFINQALAYCICATFVILNKLYIFWLRKSNFQFLIAATAPLQLHMGALIVEADDRVPSIAYLVAFTFMATVHTVVWKSDSKRLEVRIFTQAQQNGHDLNSSLALLLHWLRCLPWLLGMKWQNLVGFQPPLT